MWQIYFQDAATPQMEGIIRLHNHIITFLVAIFLFVLYIFVRTLNIFYSKVNGWRAMAIRRLKKKRAFGLRYRNRDANMIFSHALFLFRFVHHKTHGTVIELIWTILPSFILLFIAYPSFALLYSLDEVVDTRYNIKIVGHQWYWSYEYLYFLNKDSTTNSLDKVPFNLSVDSYMITEADLLSQISDYVLPNHKLFRLLNVDNPLFLPTDVNVRLLITSSDVLHSWAVPSLGVKVDAVPGRLNQALIYIKRDGIYFGQCSEICGVNHGFMPIEVHALNIFDWDNIIHYYSLMLSQSL